MSTPLITSLGKRTCEENYARRAWASAHGRKPGVLLQTLGNLLPVLESPRPLYGRLARQAMASGDAQKMLDAIKMVGKEIDYCRTERAKLMDHYGRLSTAA